jgi:ATP-binding cassette subfamily A (ABC1) protein 3
MFFITYAKNFFIPNSTFSSPNPLIDATPIRSFADALGAAQGGRDKVVFVNNGNTGGAIDDVIQRLSNQVRDAGLTPITVEQDVELLTTCAGSLRGASTCFGAASFHSSPDGGSGSGWNYTLRGDGILGEQIFVDKKDNDIEIYTLPFQRAIDEAIISRSRASELPAVVEFPFTDKTQEERDERIRVLYMGALINIMGAALYIGVCGGKLPR